MEKEQPNYYAIIPAEIRYNKDLAPNEKLLYGEITALCNKTGQCFATNNYFAELYNVEIETISRWIKHLINNNFITSYVDKEKGNLRYIQLNQYLLTNLSIPIDKKINSPIDKKINENNTDNNITFNNTNNKKNKKEKLPKHKYGEYQNVLLTDEEYNKLVEKFGENKALEKIENMDKGIEMKGYKYNSHYLAILNWDRRDKPLNKKSNFATHEYSKEDLDGLFDNLDNVKLV